MNCFCKNIKAFSVLEAVFSMVITAIIIGIVFVIFGILTERMMDFKEENQLIADINRLSYSLQKDMFDHAEMEVDDHQLLFIEYSGNKTKYLIKDEYLLRAQNQFIDTFYLALKKVKLDTLKSTDERNVYQELNLELEINNQKDSLKFYKRIYADRFIKSIKLD